MSEVADIIGAGAPVPKSSPPSEGKKVIIKCADMKDDMQTEAVEIASNAFEKYGLEKDVAEHIKKEFDKKHGATWHCIVGKNFDLGSGGVSTSGFEVKGTK